MIRSGRLATAVALVSLLTGLTGCGGAPTGAQVGGTVTWRGGPLPEGTITFEPADPAGRPEGTDVRNGAFALKLLPGPYRVKVRASRAAGIDKVVNAPKFEQYIPAQYNVNTTLTADVPEGGDPALAFALVDQPAPPAAR
ncbi:hypothetical protein [Gemmata sp.]|uniref:hypothetical protein n=1 Tax=Gemmata sp. TaxID=1914242 RepID=UPI003F72E6EB